MPTNAASQRNSEPKRFSPEELLAQQFEATSEASTLADRHRLLAAPADEATTGTRGHARPGAIEPTPHAELGSETATVPEAPADVADVQHDTPCPTSALAGVAEHDADERTLRLRRFQPAVRARKADIDLVRPQVVALVWRIDTHSWESDRAMLGVAYSHAIWSLHHQGDYDPERDLAEPRLESYRRQALGHHPESTQATYMSALRRLRRGGPAAPGLRRKTASAPFLPREGAMLWEIAEEAGARSLETQMLLTLTLGAGLRPDEVNRATVDWLVRIGHRIYVVVPDRDGAYREIPVFGRHERFLHKWHIENGTQDRYLLWNDFSQRRNVISKLKSNLKKQDPRFDIFDASRARHTWLTGLLTAQVPFHVICAIAGIGPDSNLPTDLIPYTPSVTIRSARAAIERCHLIERRAT